jgi:2-iminobutanoate/2-iminopropanoate deaminase
VIERWLAPDNDGGRYSSAVRSGPLIFVSGQLGAQSRGEAVPFADQLRLALERLFEAVRALGGDRSSILKVNGYVARLEDFASYHVIYAEAFSGVELPARTTVQVAGFREPILVEIDAIATTLQLAEGG